MQLRSPSLGFRVTVQQLSVRIYVITGRYSHVCSRFDSYLDVHIIHVLVDIHRDQGNYGI